MRILMLLLASSLLFGCSSTPSATTKGQAVYYALAADTLSRTWEESCKAVNLDVRQKATLTRQQWWERNGAFVEAADFGLAYGIIKISDERIETGARLALAVTWDIVENADKKVADRLAKGNAAATCAEVIEAYGNGQYDLIDNKKYYKQLVELQSLQQLKEEDVKLKQASVERINEKEYGRSFYVVEKTAEQYECPNAQVQLIKNSWPRELYDVTCPDKSNFYVQCEWGSCGLIK